MFIRMFSLILLCSALAVGQTADQAQSANATQQASRESNGEMSVTGCVSRLNTSFILMQTEPAVSYKLEPRNKLKLEQYLGKEVEVTGIESSSLTTSSPSASSANPLTITIHSIKTVHQRCSAR
jgi:hypothetical protein